MVVVAQLVRASVCGTEGRRFEPGLPPIKGPLNMGLFNFSFFISNSFQGALIILILQACTNY
jgi:hypothetical protein